MKTSTLIASSLFALALAQPVDRTPRKRAADPNSVKILETIAPSSTSCDNAPAAGECATAADAAQPLVDSFATYKVSTPGEQAALLSWMAYESAEFKYVRNHFPGTPGQGCRNMMMPNFVSEYASSIGVAANSDPAALLNAVIAKDGAEWGAASWFYTTKCSQDVKNGLQAGTKDGWTSFITNCVQTTVDEGTGDKSREAYWQRAAQALGMSV